MHVVQHVCPVTQSCMQFCPTGLLAGQVLQPLPGSGVCWRTLSNREWQIWSQREAVGTSLDERS